VGSPAPAKEAAEFAPRKAMRRALGKRLGDRVATRFEHNRDRRGGCFGGESRQSPANCADNRNPAIDQICGQCRQAVVLSVRPAIFDLYILPVDKAGFPQAEQERFESAGAIGR
jgi:hypothetical protein